MKIRLLAICLAALVAGLASLPIKAQTAPSSAAPVHVATAAPTQAAPQQAYTLPPDKLAQAIALSRIRITLGIVAAIWGIVFLWLLLATRAWAGIERWTQCISRHRWLQGLVFFAVFFLITMLAGLPLDALAHHFERAYGISVGQLAGRSGQSARIDASYWRAGSAALPLDRAPLAAQVLARSMGGHAPHPGLLHLSGAAVRADLLPI
jgi:hypothetical protein